MLPENGDDAASILSGLEGDELSQLLTKDKPVLFDKHKIPVLPKPYLERRFCSCREVCSKVLRHPSKDVIVVTNMNLEALQRLVNKNEQAQSFQNIGDTLDMSFRIFLMEKCDNHYSDILKAVKGQRNKDDERSIHCLQYLRDDIFQWLGTYGSLSLIKKSVIIKQTDVVLFDENELLENVNEYEKCEPIFIADKPGMGKSFVLISLANRIVENEKFKNSFVVFLNMNDFMVSMNSKVGKNSQKISKTDIIATIQACISTNRFEQNLVKYWLEQKFPNTPVTLELMLDGLDEVGKNRKEMAMRVLKTIRNELPAIRLWVTLREHMQDEVEDHFGVIGCKIQPLSENDQIRFLQQYWLSKVENSGESTKDALQTLAVKCIRLTNSGIETIEIAGAPLQCRMIGEVYEDYLSDLSLVSTDNFSITENISLTDLYEKMIDKKISEFLKVKKGYANPYDYCLHPWREDMKLWHMYLSMKLLFADWMTDMFRFYLNISAKSESIIHETVVEHGLLENLDPLRFIHITFAEFFAAFFIRKVLTGEFPRLDDDDIAAFQAFFSDQVLEVSKHQCTYNSSTYTARNSCKFKFPVLCSFLNAMLDDRNQFSTNIRNLLVKIHDFNPSLTAFDYSKSVIVASLQHNYFNLARFLLESVSSDDKSTFLDKTKDGHEFLLEIALRHASIDFFKYICSLIDDWHKTKYETTYEIPMSLFKIALIKGKFEVVKFLVENKGFGPETWSSFQNNDKKKCGVIHHIIGKSRSDSEEVLMEKRKLLEYVVKRDKTTLEQIDCEGRTPILLPFSASSNLKSFLVTNLGANVNATGNCRNTAFHWKCYTDYQKAVTPKQYHNLLEVFVAYGFNLLNYVNNFGCTPLLCAIKTYSDLLEIDTLLLLQRAGADMNAKDGNGNTALHLCIKKNCRLEFIEKLIECGADISAQNSEGQTALALANEIGSNALVKMLTEKALGDMLACVTGEENMIMYNLQIAA